MGHWFNGRADSRHVLPDVFTRFLLFCFFAIALGPIVAFGGKSENTP